MKEKLPLKKYVNSAIKILKIKDLNINNIIEYIDYNDKVRYTEEEITQCILLILKEKTDK